MPISKMSLIRSDGRNATPSPFLAIAGWLIVGVHACFGAIMSHSPEVSGALDIPHAIHIIGLGDLKSNISGDLKIDNRNLFFVTAGATTEISENNLDQPIFWPNGQIKPYST
jgi:hypothetical protein